MMMKMSKYFKPVGLAMMAILAFTPQAFAAADTSNPSHTPSGKTSTKHIRGFNWADKGDNFQKGVIYPSGLSSSDTYSSAKRIAKRVVGGFESMTGANTVRMPINEPTVSDYWGTYTGAIDESAHQGNVILAYWAYQHGKPANMTDFWNMWTTVVNKYGRNPHVYFEVINEPYGYSAADLDNMYSQWLAKFPQVPRNRVILDGTGYADHVTAVGDDSALDGTLLGVHDYGFWNPSNTSESKWASDFASQVGNYANRTVCTEFGAPMTSGYNYYDTSSSNAYVAFIRGITSELRTLGMGSVLWPGLRDGDTYSLTTRNGSGADITLTLNNATGLARLRYGWGLKPTGASAVPPVQLGQVRTEQNGNQYNVIANVTNFTNTTQALTLTADVPKGWTTGPVSVSVPAQGTKNVTIPVAPPNEVSVLQNATISVHGTYHDEVLNAMNNVALLVVPTDIVAEYPFNEISGNTASDASGNNFSATLNGGASWVAGENGNAVSLDGKSGYVSVPTAVTNMDDFTIATWVKLNTVNTWSRIFDFGTGTDSYMFLTPQAGGAGLRFAIQAQGGGEQQLNAPALQAGTWVNVAVTLHGTTGTLYVNGQAVDTNTSMTFNPSSLGLTTNDYIGKSQFSADPYLNGAVDDFRIYNRALSASEINTLYQGN